MLKLRLFSAAAVLFMALSAQAQKLRVAVAANAQFVSQKLAEAFKAETGIETELVVGASGKLTTQIEQGAPFDVFLSADMKYPEELYSKGLATEKPRVYGYGELVMWSRLKDVPLKSPADLTSEVYQKIAVANPQLAPYGEAALQALEKLKLSDRLKSKIVYGESIAQVNQFLLSGAVEVAFTAKAVVLDPAQQGKGQWVAVDESLYHPIAQGVVIIKSLNGNLENAKKFYNFLHGSTAKKILRFYGYKV